MPLFGIKQPCSHQGSQVPSDLHQPLLPLGRFQDVSLQSAKPVRGSPGTRRHFPDSSRLFLLPPCTTGNCQTTEMLGKAQQGLLESTDSSLLCFHLHKVLHWQIKCSGHLKLFLHWAEPELGMNSLGTKYKHCSKGQCGLASLVSSSPRGEARAPAQLAPDTTRAAQRE